MIITKCDRCGRVIPVTDNPNQLAIHDGDEYQFYHYCDKCYPRVLAELIPILKGRDQ